MTLKLKDLLVYMTFTFSDLPAYVTSLKDLEVYITLILLDLPIYMRFIL